MSVTITAFVHGTPSAQGSKRHVGNGRLVDMNANLQPWRDSITYAVRAAAGDTLNWRSGVHEPVFTGPVAVTLQAWYPRPKSHYRTGASSHLLRADAPLCKTSAPDADKVARAVLDAITASGVWRDDAQVASLHVTKAYGPDPGLDITITEAKG